MYVCMYICHKTCRLLMHSAMQIIKRTCIHMNVPTYIHAHAHTPGTQPPGNLRAPYLHIYIDTRTHNSHPPHTYTHTYTHATHIYIDTRTHTFTPTTYIHAHVHTRQVCNHPEIFERRTYTYTQIHAHIHSHPPHTYTHTYTHARYAIIPKSSSAETSSRRYNSKFATWRRFPYRHLKSFPSTLSITIRSLLSYLVWSLRRLSPVYSAPRNVYVPSPCRLLQATR